VGALAATGASAAGAAVGAAGIHRRVFYETKGAEGKT